MTLQTFRPVKINVLRYWQNFKGEAILCKTYKKTYLKLTTAFNFQQYFSQLKTELVQTTTSADKIDLIQKLARDYLAQVFGQTRLFN